MIRHYDLNGIKYYPDKFYVCLDGIDIENLMGFFTNFDIDEQQAAFIHEYYHYLTNITTFAGVRQFNLNFIDRFRVIVNLIDKEQLNAFPINSNKTESCSQLIEYWRDISEILNNDDIDYDFARIVEQSPSKKFTIQSFDKISKNINSYNGDKEINGCRIFIKVNIDGIINKDSFILSFGSIDEFLSAAIDEFLFENNFSNVNHRDLDRRPYYPYKIFDDILSHYGICRATSLEKIVLAYYALHSENPPVTLIEVLEYIQKDNVDLFRENPEVYLLAKLKPHTKYNDTLNYTKAYCKEASDQNRIHISQAVSYFYDQFYIAKSLKEQDFFYFIRPFLIEKKLSELRGKQSFLLSLSRLLNVFNPPVILKENQFKFFSSMTTVGESVLHILATYEIYKSLETEKIAKRPDYYKNKYSFPDMDEECDVYEKFPYPPFRSVFHLALNELNLMIVYLKERDKNLWSTLNIDEVLKFHDIRIK